jgi:hypothetical protein
MAIASQTMAGGTHVFDMIKRLRNNENLRKKNYFKTKNTYHRTAASLNIDVRTANYEEREKLRNKIIQSQAREKRTKIKALLVSILLTAILVIAILKFVLP